MNYYFTAQNEGNVPKTYDRDVLEGNWYEDRCVSDYDMKKKKDYMLKSIRNIIKLLMRIYNNRIGSKSVCRIRLQLNLI